MTPAKIHQPLFEELSPRFFAVLSMMDLFKLYISFHLVPAPRNRSEIPHRVSPALIVYAVVVVVGRVVGFFVVVEDVVVFLLTVLDVMVIGMLLVSSIEYSQSPNPPAGEPSYLLRYTSMLTGYPVIRIFNGVLLFCQSSRILWK